MHGQVAQVAITGAIHVDRRFNSHVGIGSREHSLVSVTDRVNFIIAPPCDNNINMKDNIFVKEALFQFIVNIDRKL